jgi:DNA-binding response OmpR family regulator
MDSPLLLIHGDREEDLQFRSALRGAVPHLRLHIARHPREIDLYPVPKLILLDLDLCHPPALEMLEWLRSGRLYDRVPLIVLSSSRETNHVTRALELGALSCVLKPANPALLDGVAKGIGMYAKLLANQ